MTFAVATLSLALVLLPVGKLEDAPKLTRESLASQSEEIAREVVAASLSAEKLAPTQKQPPAAAAPALATLSGWQVVALVGIVAAAAVLTAEVVDDG